MKFLNSIKTANLPLFDLKLKNNTLIMLVHNLSRFSIFPIVGTFFSCSSLHTYFIHILMLSPISLHSSYFRMIYHLPLLLSIKHKVFSIIFLAAFLTFIPKTPSTNSQIIFLKLFHPSSILSSFKLSSLVFNSSWKASLNPGVYLLHGFPEGSYPSKISALN